MSLDISAGGFLQESKIDIKQHVASGTSMRVLLTTATVVLSTVVMVLATFGIVLLVLALGWIVTWWRQRFFRSVLHGSAIKVTEKQFPEIFNCVKKQSSQLGLKTAPQVYICEGNVQNAFATKHGGTNHIVLIDDIVFGALKTKNTKILDFIIGHELAHIALGHTKVFRGWLRTVNRKLSRLDEFSCDAIANELVGDMAAGRDALALLTIGPQLYQVLNREALESQVNEVAMDKRTRKAEAVLSHPLLLRRYARIAGKPIKA